MRTVAIYSLSNFQMHTLVLLTVVTTLYMTAPGLTCFITGRLFLVTLPPFPINLTSISSIVLCVGREMKGVAQAHTAKPGLRRSGLCPQSWASLHGDASLYSGPACLQHAGWLRGSCLASLGFISSLWKTRGMNKTVPKVPSHSDASGPGLVKGIVTEQRA